MEIATFIVAVVTAALAKFNVTLRKEPVVYVAPDGKVNVCFEDAAIVAMAHGEHGYTAYGAKEILRYSDGPDSEDSSERELQGLLDDEGRANNLKTAVSFILPILMREAMFTASYEAQRDEQRKVDEKEYAEEMGG